MHSTPVLVTGAAGYVGGRLTPLLLEAGWRVRAVVRSPARLADRPWSNHPNLETVQADALDPAAMARAAEGCFAAYYLIHSMRAGGGDFAKTDQRAARIFADACAAGGMKRIIYLGGLGEEEEDLSEHLRSRLEVAGTLAAGRTPVTFLRAAMLLGAGSASFEIMRYLVERLPIMTTPTWVRTKSAPIAISNALGYLAGCLDHPETTGQTYGVCGPEALSYEELFDIYGQEAGLTRRVIIPAPLLTPWLSSLWIGLVTPVPTALARPLIEGLRNEAVCRENRIRDIIPLRLLTAREAIRLALQSPLTPSFTPSQVRSSPHAPPFPKRGIQGPQTPGERVQRGRSSLWPPEAAPKAPPTASGPNESGADGLQADAAAAPPAEWSVQGDADYAGGAIRSVSYRARVRAAPEEAFAPIARIGGETGWYYADALWSLRGGLDALLGGTGARRGRPGGAEPRVGETLDFWLVLAYEPPHRMLLLAEMKMPGEATLELGVAPAGVGESEIRATLRFRPRGVGGEIYWRLVSPLDRYVHKGMLRGIVAAIGKPVTLAPEPTGPR